MIFGEAGDTRVVGHERAGALNRRGDQQAVSGVLVRQIAQLIGTRRRSMAQGQHNDSRVTGKAFDPGIGGMIQINPPAVHELCDLPRGDGTDQDRSALVPTGLDQAERGGAQPRIAIVQP